MLLTMMNQKNSYLRNMTETSTEHAYAEREGEREKRENWQYRQETNANEIHLEPR